MKQPSMNGSSHETMSRRWGRDWEKGGAAGWRRRRGEEWRIKLFHCHGNTQRLKPLPSIWEFGQYLGVSGDHPQYMDNVIKNASCWYREVGEGGRGQGRSVGRKGKVEAFLVAQISLATAKALGISRLAV